jgi:hypothetical protein
MTPDEALDDLVEWAIEARFLSLKQADARANIIRTAFASSREEGPGWQPIETAPRDGSWFVICREDETDFFEVGNYETMMGYSYEEVNEGLYRRREFFITEWGSFSNFHRATHWRPLPAPPQTEGQE